LQDVDGNTVYVSKVMVTVNPGLYFREGRIHIVINNSLLLGALL